LMTAKRHGRLRQKRARTASSSIVAHCYPRGTSRQRNGMLVQTRKQRTILTHTTVAMALPSVAVVGEGVVGRVLEAAAAAVLLQRRGAAEGAAQQEAAPRLENLGSRKRIDCFWTNKRLSAKRWLPWLPNQAPIRHSCHPVLPVDDVFHFLCSCIPAIECGISTSDGLDKGLWYWLVGGHHRMSGWCH
jgi:hypothetical protein